MTKVYKFGIIKRLYDSRNIYIRNIGVCSCGQVNYATIARSHRFECQKCGNTYFVNAEHQTGRFVIPYIETLRKDNRGFKVKRVNLSIIYDVPNTRIVIVKENLTRTVDYDIVDRRLTVHREDEVEYDYNLHGHNEWVMDKSHRGIFTQLEERDFLEFVSNDVTRSLFTKVVPKLSNNGWRKKNKTLFGLIRLFEYQHLQILSSAGIPDVDRFYESRSTYNNRSVLDYNKTKPNEIMKLPKYMIQYMREDNSINIYSLEQLQHSTVKIDGNRFKEILSIAKDESTIKKMIDCIDDLVKIHVDYGYNNLRKLVLYIFRETRLTQGITNPRDACTYLKDYIKMSNAMGLEYEKYPKSLKKEHDIVQMNYKVKEDVYKQKAFVESVTTQSYRDLLFKDKKFSIISPTTPDDLINEGNQLSHCVASYVNDVTDSKCKIYFLRNNEDLGTPLATIEVRGVNIRQAKGRSNRPVGKEEMEFIKKWSEKKMLNEAYY